MTEKEKKRINMTEQEKKEGTKEKKGVERNSEGKRGKRIRNIEKCMIEDRWTQNDGKKGNRKEERKDRR